MSRERSPGVRKLNAVRTSVTQFPTPSDVCYVELTGDGQVSLLALPTVDLMTAKDDVVPELVLRNGEYGSAAGLD